LTLHRAADNDGLVCHHCGHRERVPRNCPECRSTTIARQGAGTQRIESELAEALAPLPVFRLDSDAARRKHGIAEVLEAFGSARSGVLVGTQMVAQGHDFPDVELAIVQDADAALRFPDFRAEEGGKVLVQSLVPESRCLRHAASHDAPAFLEEEITRRRALRYPPFSRIARVVTAARTEVAAERAAARVRAGLKATGMELLGPAPLFRLKDRHRFVLLIKGPAVDVSTAGFRAGPVESTAGLPAGPLDVGAIGEVVQRTAADRSLRGVSFAVDIDPQ
jgi:primosomal protein N' (replication factor Y)